MVELEIRLTSFLSRSMVPVDELGAGEVGYLTASIKIFEYLGYGSFF